MIKRILQFIAGCVFVFLLLLAVTPTILSLTPVRNYVLNKVNSSIHGKISITNFSVGWFSGVQIENILITDPEQKEVASIKKIDASGSLITLLTNPKNFGALLIDAPSCTLIEDEKGLSLERIFAQEKPTKEAIKEAPQEKTSSSSPSFYMASIKINNGSVQLIEKNGPKLSIENIQAELSLQGLDKALCTLTANVVDTDKKGSIAVKSEASDLKALYHWYQDTLEGKKKESSTSPDLALNATIKDLPTNCIDAFVTLGQKNARGILINAIGSPLNATLIHNLKDNVATTNFEITSSKLNIKSTSTLANNTLTFTDPANLTWQIAPDFFNLATKLNENTKHITLTAPSALHITLAPVSIPLPITQAKTALTAHLGIDPLILYHNEKKLPLGTCTVGCDITHNPQSESILLHAVAQCDTSTFTSNSEIKLNGTKPFLTSSTSFSLQTQPLLALANISGADLMPFLGQQINGKLDITLPEESSKVINGILRVTSNTFELDSTIQKLGHEITLPFTFTYECKDNPLSEKITKALQLKDPFPLRCSVHGDAVTLNLANISESRCNLLIDVPACTIEGKECAIIQLNKCQVSITKNGPKEELKASSSLQLDFSKASMVLNTFIGPTLEITSESKPLSKETTLEMALGTHALQITSQNFSGALNLPGKYNFSYSIPKELINLYITLVKPEYPYVFEKNPSLVLSGNIGSSYPVTTDVSSQTLFRHRTDNNLIPSSLRFSTSFKPYTLTGSLHSLSGEGTNQNNFDGTFTWDHCNNISKTPLGIGLFTLNFKANNNLQDIKDIVPPSYRDLLQLCGQKVTYSCQAQLCEPKYGASSVDCDLNSDVGKISASVVVAIDPKTELLSIHPKKGASKFFTLDTSCTPALWSALQKSNLINTPLLQKLSLQRPVHANIAISSCDLKLPMKKNSTESLCIDCKAALSVDELLFQDSKGEQFGLAASKGTIDISNTHPLSVALISEKAHDTLTAFSLNMRMSEIANPMKEHQFSFAFENVITRVVDMLITKDKDNSMAALFGQSMNGSINGSITDGSGSYSLHLNTPTLNVKGEFGMQKGILLLKEPFTASLTVDREQGKTLCHHFIPNITSCLYSNTPITLTIQPQGFAIPISGFTKEKITIPNIRIELNKIMVEKTGTLDTISAILRLDTGNELSLWATPIYGSMNNGIFTLQRFDALIDRKIQIASWGSVDYARDNIDIIVGILGNGLSHVLDLQHLPANYVLQLPLKGKTSYATINKQAAIAKIASLKMVEIPDKNLAILGGLIQAATSAAAPDAPVPPPTTQPLPWERSNPRNDSW